MQKIMFSDKLGLTQAVLEGRKTMTRRMIAAPKNWHGLDVYGFSVNKDNLGNVKDISLLNADGGCIEDENGSLGMILPKYNIGEIIAVAQSYKDAGINGLIDVSFDGVPYYAKDLPGWTNKMFVRADLMPHQIRITDIKVERLQDISDEDCLKEGVAKLQQEAPCDGFFIRDELHYSNLCYNTPREAFSALIDKVSGKGTWDSNPYVFVYEFKLVK